MRVEWNDPWLVAVWPGMGGIAQIAGRYLVRALGARQIAEVPPEAYFDVRSISVRDGLIQRDEPPQSRFFGWKDPAQRRDLVLFLGDEQPADRGHAFCGELLDVAVGFGVKRVVTFAAMATPRRPEGAGRVFAAATDEELLAEVRAQPVEVLREAEITGLNGVLLSVAAARGLGGVCLLGEFPYFAGSIANPQASVAVLQTFANLAGVAIDLAELRARAAEVRRALVEHLRRLEKAAELAASLARRAPVHDRAEEALEEQALDPAAEARIEALFEAARGERAKALELKAELDRQGVFDEYEDRFLDLFKQAE